MINLNTIYLQRTIKYVTFVTIRMEKELKNKLTDILSKIELFRSFGADQLNKIVSNSSIRFQNYKDDSIIISQGDVYSELLILVKGTCISEITGYNGRIIQIGHLKAPFIIAPAAFFSKNKISPVTIKTGGKDQSGIVQLIVIPGKDLTYLISTSALFTRNLLTIVSEMVISLSERVSFLTLNNIEEKFMNYLARIKEKNREEEIILPVKLENLAAYFGVERPSLSRSIGRLIEKGKIRKSRKGGKLAYIITAD